MKADPKTRERLAVEARRAIQYARFWLDFEDDADPAKALAWAQRAEDLARQFRSAVEAEYDAAPY